MPIVKSLVELHEGVFELRSEVRKGTEVLVTIPRQRVMEALPPLQPLGQERHRLNTGYGEWDRPARLGGRAPHASMMG